jgi:hypothetical protein
MKFQVEFSNHGHTHRTSSCILYSNMQYQQKLALHLEQVTDEHPPFFSTRELHLGHFRLSRSISSNICGSQSMIFMIMSSRMYPLGVRSGSVQEHPHFPHCSCYRHFIDRLIHPMFPHSVSGQNFMSRLLRSSCLSIVSSKSVEISSHFMMCLFVGHITFSTAELIYVDTHSFKHSVHENQPQDRNLIWI